MTHVTKYEMYQFNQLKFRYYNQIFLKLVAMNIELLSLLKWVCLF